jgi:hypothetical protein
VSWKHAPVAALLIAAVGVLPCARAEADCAGHPEIDEYVPHEVDTPKGNHISYRYDFVNGNYFVVVTRGSGEGVPRGPYELTTGGCLAAKVEWESEQFVVLSAGCGTFCWWGEAIPVASNRKPVNMFRPFAFDPERNLIAYYPEPDVITVINVATGREQSMWTPAHCPSVSGTCFDEKLDLSGGRLRYVWKYWEPLPDDKFKFFPDKQIDVELDADVTRGP